MDVFFNDVKEHKNHLTLIFTKNSLLINAKENGLIEEIHFLGQNVSKQKVQMDYSRVEATNSWTGLKTFHVVHVFLGLCSYSVRFKCHFAEIASRLHGVKIRNYF